MSRVRHSTRLLVSLVLAGALSPGAAVANVTPFGQAVNDAIDRGLGFLRSHQNNNGGMDDGEGGGTTGLAMLCLLEKALQRRLERARPSVTWAWTPPTRTACAAASGTASPTSPASAGGGSESYKTGNCLMAASLYLASGGPTTWASAPRSARPWPTRCRP
jgi:hypothetical protein